MTNPEIGGTAQQDSYVVQPSPEQIAAFAVVIGRSLGQAVNYSVDPTSGHQWTWVSRGLWSLTVGGILTPEPQLQGPHGRWRLATASIMQADLVVLMLQLAGGLPTSAAQPRPRTAAPPVQAPLPSRLPGATLTAETYEPPVAGPRSGPPASPQVDRYVLDNGGFVRR